MTDARVRRGRETEELEASYLLPLFPDAVAVGNSLPGRDILNTPGLAAEVKARRRFEPLTAMAQAKRNANGDIPMVVLRMPGQGEAAIDDWLVMFTNKDARELIGRAFNLGEYARTPDQSSSEERSQGSFVWSGLRVEPGTDHARNEMDKGFLSAFLYAVGFGPGEYEVSVRRRESSGSSSA